MTPAQRVLVIDRDPAVRELVRDVLDGDALDCDLAAGPSEAAKALEDPRVACAVLDLRAGEPDSLVMLRRLRDEHPVLRVIVMAGSEDGERVLEALRLGACDYLARPLHREELRLAVRRALEAHGLESELAAARDELAGRHTPAELLREICEGMTREIDPARLLAASLRPVARATAARSAALYLVDERGGRLLREAQCSGADEDRPELPRDRGLSGGCLQSGALVASEHPEREARFDPAVDTPASGVPGPLLVVPLKVRERGLGIVRIFPAAEKGADAGLAEWLSAPLSAATRNVLLYRSLLDSVEDLARARREVEAVQRS